MTKGLSQFARVASTGVDIGLGVANVGFDAFELANAQNEIEKAEFGTRLAFDSASLGVGIGGVAAGWAGAGTVAGFLGPLSVPLAGLAIGFGGLARAYAKVGQDAAAVGAYLSTIEKAYNEYGYHCDSSNNLIIPLAGAVIEEVDLNEGKLKFDSQYIYRTHHGSTGSGYINYFFWAGDFPKMVNDEAQAINIRHKTAAQAVRGDDPIYFGGSSTQSSTYKRAVNFVLPSTPKSYISYSYNTLPFATARNDAGFSVLRKLEEDYTFDFDFYSFPSEWIIDKIRQHYKSTDIKVSLGNQDRNIYVPKLPNSIHGYINYELSANGGKQNIILEPGVKLSLKQTSATDLVIDARGLSNDQVSLDSDHITISGLRINISSDIEKLKIITSNHGQRTKGYNIYLTGTPKMEEFFEDVSNWPETGQNLLDHIIELKNKHMLSGQYIVVKNYEIINPINGEKQTIKTAYFDVENKKFIYGNIANDELTDDAELKAVVGNIAYFFNKEKGSLWSIDINTHEVVHEYLGLAHNNNSQITRVWQEANNVLFSQKHKLKNGHEAEFIIKIDGDNANISGIVAQEGAISPNTLIDYEEDHRYPYPNDFRRHLISLLDIDENDFYGHWPRKKVGANLPDAIVIAEKKGSNQQNISWVDTVHGKIIEPNIPEMSQQQSTTLTGPDDFILADTAQYKGKMYFYFYSHKRKEIYRQEAVKHGSTIKPVASLVNIGEVNNVINHKTRFAISNFCFILKFLRDNTYVIYL